MCVNYIQIIGVVANALQQIFCKSSVPVNSLRTCRLPQIRHSSRTVGPWLSIQTLVVSHTHYRTTKNIMSTTKKRKYFSTMPQTLPFTSISEIIRNSTKPGVNRFPQTFCNFIHSCKHWGGGNWTLCNFGRRINVFKYAGLCLVLLAYVWFSLLWDFRPLCSDWLLASLPVGGAAMNTWSIVNVRQFKTRGSRPPSLFISGRCLLMWMASRTFRGKYSVSRSIIRVESQSIWCLESSWCTDRSD